MPEVPVGRMVYNRHNHKLVVNSLGGNTHHPWSDEARAPLYRSIDPKDLVAADVVYVLVSEVGEWCTRSDAKFLFDWLVRKRNGRSGVKMVTNLSILDQESREREEQEILEQKISVIEVEDKFGETFFADILRRYGLV